MHPHAKRIPSASSRPLSAGLLAVALAAVMAATGGCQAFSEPEPKQPRTVTEFMKQPRPGEGVLGP